MPCTGIRRWARPSSVCRVTDPPGGVSVSLPLFVSVELQPLDPERDGRALHEADGAAFHPKRKTPQPLLLPGEEVGLLVPHLDGDFPRPGRLDEAINRATGYFQADCRGAGTDWQVAEIRRIKARNQS